MTWPKVKLGDLIVANYGKALKSENRDDSGEHDVFGSNGYVGKHSSTLISQPTIIIGRKGSVGAITYAPVGGWTIDTAYYVTQKKESDFRFLFYALKNAELESLAITTSIPGLNRDSLYRVEIPLPPIAEQKRLAAILDRADELRRARRQSLRVLDELAQSLFLELFGDPATNPKDWDVVRLGEICTIERNGIEASRITSGTTYVGLENIEKTGSFNQVSTVESGDLASTKFHFDSRHVLYGKLRPYLSKIACPTFEGVCSTDILPLLPKSTMHRAFLFSFLRLPDVVSLAASRSTGANLPRLSPKALTEFQIPLPPLSLQQQFAQQIEELEAIKMRARASLLELDALFACLQSRAFAGELSAIEA